MKFRLNRKSLERAKSFVRAGQYVPQLVAPPVLEAPPNWPEYMQSFLGIRFDKPDDDTETGYEDSDAPHVDWYEYPFSDGTQLGEKNLTQIKAKAQAAGEGDIADAAQTLLDLIAAKAPDKQVEQRAQSNSKNGDLTGANGENRGPNSVASVISCSKNGDLTGANRENRDRNPNSVSSVSSCSNYERDIKWESGTAGVKAAAGKKNKLPVISGTAYTGVAMELDGFDSPLVIDNAGWDFTSKSRPILKDHDPAKPIGNTTSVQLAGQDLLFAGVASASGPHVNEVVEAGKNDFPWQVSVGAKVLAAEFLPKGKTVTVNGQTFEGPKIISRKTRLKEISILSLGADDDSAARIAARARVAGSSIMKLKKKFAAWLKGKGMDPAQCAADDGLLSHLKAAYEAAMKCKADDDSDDDYEDDDETPEQKPAKSAAVTADILAHTKTGEPAPIEVKAILAEAHKEFRAEMAKESKRLAKISKVADSYRGRVDGAKVEEFRAKAIEAEITCEGFELELIKAARPEVKNVYANSGRGSETTGAIIAAAAARGNGLTEKTAYEGLDEKSANIAASLKGMSLHRIIAAVAPMIGMTAAAGGINDSFLGNFLAQDRQSHARQIAEWESQTGMAFASGAGGGGFSTMSLTGITENILYKSMLEMYKLQASIIPDICYERDTQDFKPFKVYRLTASGDLAPVSPTGEIESISLQDASYSNTVSSRAALLVLTRENLMNDDMGALQQSAQILARKSALNREKAVLTTFISGLSTIATGPSVGKPANSFDFWSTGAKNYLSGSTSALSITSLTTAVQKFIQQTDDNGDPVMLIPDRLLLCPELKATGENLFNGAALTVQALALPTSGAQTAAQVPNVNQHKGMYRPLVTPFLGGASPISGATSTQWALLTNPAGGAATVQVGYLRGQRTPILRQVELEASRLGVGFQVVYDFGVALLDWRCGVYSAGA